MADGAAVLMRQWNAGVTPVQKPRVDAAVFARLVRDSLDHFEESKV